jgi:putative SOS response-associated peptidase YedK
MCGRYTLTKKQQEIAERFNAKIEGLIKELFNAAPSQNLPVITDVNPAKIALHKWGLVPSWAKDTESASGMINARAETLKEKPLFSNLLEHQRCLVPADGFYEWKNTPGGKQPYRITLANRDLFAFAGLWDKWKAPSGLLVYTFTIITTEPNKLTQSIHNRMPAILSKEDEKKWLNPNLTTDEIQKMLKPYPAEEMKVYPVSTAVNDAKDNSARLIEEINLTEENTLF